MVYFHSFNLFHNIKIVNQCLNLQSSPYYRLNRHAQYEQYGEGGQNKEAKGIPEPAEIRCTTARNAIPGAPTMFLHLHSLKDEEGNVVDKYKPIYAVQT
ncbi:MAG: hypothetical protein IPL13_17475 [Saprospiraceae bacterium]|nr:hypothetical protein [Candidatus Brachybacter algidus]